MMLKIQGRFNSTDKKNSVVYNLYIEANTAPVAVVHVLHGMFEYIGRYEGLAEYLTKLGIVVCGQNHLGHKRSVITNDDLGYFGDTNGDSYLVEDTYKMVNIIKGLYPNIPYFIMGHSMGSFIARILIQRHTDFIDGLILSGTASSNSASSFALFVSGLISLLKGKRHRSKFIHNNMLKHHNKAFANENSGESWLTSDPLQRDSGIDDIYRNFVFTAKGFNDLFKLLKQANHDNFFKAVKDIPLFIFSGSDDPIGEFSKGIETIKSRILHHHPTKDDLIVKLYPNARHEVIHDFSKEECFKDIADFVLSLSYEE